MDVAPERHIDQPDNETEPSRSLPGKIWEEGVPDGHERTVTHRDAVVSNTTSNAPLYGQGALLAAHWGSEATPLHLALRRQDANTAQILANDLNGYNVDIKDEFGLTALHVAIRLGDSAGSVNDKIVKVLLSKGADVYTKSCTGRSAVDEASKLYNERIFEILKNHKTTINLERSPRDKLWSELRAYMLQEFADPNASTVRSKMEAYTITHDLMSRRQGDSKKILYCNIHDCIAEHVHEIACAAKRLPKSQICAFYCKEWQRFEKAAKHHGDSFQFLNRHWVATEIDQGATNISYIKEMHFLVWKERLFHSVPLLIPAIADLWSEEKEKEPVAEQLKNVLRRSAEAMIIDLERIISETFEDG